MVKEVTSTSQSQHVIVATFNVLADCYADSHRKSSNADEARLDWKVRSCRIEKILRFLVNVHGVDILCLQEVDKYNSFYSEQFRKLEFQHIYYQRPKRSDGVLIAWRSAAFTLTFSEYINFNHIEGTGYFGKKHNVALICGLQSKFVSSKWILVANSHLHWNPARNALKLMQTEYLTKEVHKLNNANGLKYSCLLCGDFNSMPKSQVYRLLVNQQVHVPSVKGFLCDPSLGKVAKFMRALGIDCEHVRELTSDITEIFEECRKSSRVLITRSRSFYLRKECPPACLVKSTDAEKSFLQVVEECNLRLNPDLFYTRCVKCNGMITKLERSQVPEHRIGRQSSREDDDKNYVPRELFEDSSAPLSKCNGCEQIYWWSEETRIQTNVDGVKIKNSSERAQETVNKLVSLAEQRRSERVNAHLESTIHGQTFQSPLKLASAFHSVARREPKSTNNTQSFVGCLDYIFFEKSTGFRVVDAYTLPNADDCNILPDKNWPSDHKCVIGVFML